MDISIIPRTASKGNTETAVRPARVKSTYLHRLSVLAGASLRVALRPARLALRSASRSFMRVRAAAEPKMHRERLPRLLGAFILAASVIMIISTAMVGIGVQVYLDGEPVGFVENRKEFYQIVSNVEAKASVILGYPYTLNLDVDYSLEVYDRRATLDAEAVEQVLFNGIGEVAQLYVLTINGEVLAANSNRVALENVLTGIIDRSLEGENGEATAFFAQDVNVALQFTSTEKAASINEIESMLLSNVVDETIYIVTEGDTFADIAARNGLSSDTLALLNPEVDPDALVVGETLVVGEAVPLMSVHVSKRVEYDVDIQYDTQYVYSSTMWDGDRVVSTKGVNGQMHVVADVTYTDGKESAHDVVSEDVTLQPVTEVITMGTRNFILPFPGYKTISSRFGGRIYNGKYDNHTGIDFAGSYGSRVVASYSGTVTWSGWKGNYGNCVIIDHGGGYKTLYAHNSKLAVKVGQKVGQGDTVAYVGSTGRSTGNHCHFEIIINGKPVNPWKYLFN